MTPLAQAVAALRANKLQDADRLYRKILRAEPEHAEALHGLGIVQLQMGQHARALGFFERALRVTPDISQLWNNHATALNALKREEEALASLDRALALAPNDALLHYNRGNTLMSLKCHEEALAAFTRALELNPVMRPAWQNKAIIEQRLGFYEAALESSDRLIALAPDAPEARQSRGEALLSLFRHEDAIADLAAAAGALGLANSHVNHAFALAVTGRTAEAQAAVERALAADPELVLAHWNKASICLSNGDLERGWLEYEWRWHRPDMRDHFRVFRQPLWLGQEDLAGRRILLHAEQGFGDTIQFCRYVPLVRARGARVLFEAPRPLLELMRTLDGPDEWIEYGTGLPEFDLQCPLMSLPLAFSTRLETIPASVPYLAANPARVARWQALLGPSDKPRIGLAWSGAAGFAGDPLRSAPLAELAPLIRDGFTFIGVQRDVRPADAEAAATLGVRLMGQHITDFADSAALSSLMDLVISVDSAPAHLAGALAQPVWVLLPYTAEWRWLKDREDSPWYPTARLFRQKQSRDWAGVAARVGDELEARKNVLF